MPQAIAFAPLIATPLKSWRLTSMQNLSSGTYTFYESTLKGSPSLVLQLMPMDDFELPSTLQALQREDLLLHFPTSARAQTYRMWKTDLGHVSSLIRDTNSATSISSNPTPASAELFIGICSGIAVTSILVSLVIFIHLSLGSLTETYLGTAILLTTAAWLMVSSIVILLIVTLRSD